jgi:hypothetical protein
MGKPLPNARAELKRITVDMRPEADFRKRAAEPYWRFFNWNLPSG